MILFNVNNTHKKTISQVLCQILGIGKKISLYICKQCSVLPTTPFNRLTESQKTFIIKWIDEVLIHNISFGPYYKRQLKERISFFKKLKNFRGIRHLKGLPVRGQNTHSNANTARRRRFLFFLER